jgi:hypothetical protein
MKQPRTTKLAFIVKDTKIYEKEFTFNFYGGFSLSQKQKTIDSFHKEIADDGINEILEISRKSKNPIGSSLSAFSLMLTIHNQKYPIECVYQSSKVFNHNIQFKEALNLTPSESKKLIKEKVENEKLILTGFNCFGVDFPITPTTIFYDYIYVMALYQNHEIASNVVDFYCFTDVEFNHKKQFASQARSCAIYKYLHDHDLVEETIGDISKFISLYSNVIMPYQFVLDFE